MVGACRSSMTPLREVGQRSERRQTQWLTRVQLDMMSRRLFVRCETGRQCLPCHRHGGQEGSRTSSLQRLDELLTLLANA